MIGVTKSRIRLIWRAISAIPCIQAIRRSVQRVLEAFDRYDHPEAGNPGHARGSSSSQPPTSRQRIDGAAMRRSSWRDTPAVFEDVESQTHASGVSRVAFFTFFWGWDLLGGFFRGI